MAPPEFLRARQSRALGSGPEAFLLERVAEDMAERLHAKLVKFALTSPDGLAVARRRTNRCSACCRCRCGTSGGVQRVFVNVTDTFAGAKVRPASTRPRHELPRLASWLEQVAPQGQIDYSTLNEWPSIGYPALD